MVRADALEHFSAAWEISRAEHLDNAIGASDLNGAGGRNDRTAHRQSIWPVINHEKGNLRLVRELEKIEGNLV